MHLVSPLAAGITGAENGRASIYRRGSTTPATWYEDFEGTGPSSEDVTLDQYGGAEVYVDELVTVTARDTDGNAIRTFTAGAAAPNVEVESQSFTGTSYETAITGPDKPTTLQAVLDSWYDSALTTDFQLTVNGVRTNLHTFADLVTENIFNVKDEAYGAVGDGATDDSSSIQAAINAAIEAGGGVVFFPVGTYFVNSTVSSTAPPSSPVSLKGASKGTSIILIGDSFGHTGNGIEGGGAGFSDLTIKPTSSSDMSPISLLSWSGGRIERCVLGDSSGASASERALSTSGSVTLEDCEIYTNVDSSINTFAGWMIISGSEDKLISATSCIFGASGNETPAIGSGFISFNLASAELSVSCCYFDYFGYTGSGTFTAINNTSPNTKTVCSSSVFAGGSASSTMYAFSGDGVVRSSSNLLIDNGFCRWLRDAPDATSDYVLKDRKYGVDTDNSSNIDVDPEIYRVFKIIRTDATPLALGAVSDYFLPRGSFLTVIVENVSGGTTVSFAGSDFLPVANGPNVGAGDTRVFDFVFDGSDFIQTGPSADTV